MTALKFDTDKLALDLVDAGFARALWNNPDGNLPSKSYRQLLWMCQDLTDGVLTPERVREVAGSVGDALVDSSISSGDGYTDLARVLQFGAKKYAAHNWRKGIPRARVLAAALRHLNEAEGGRFVDDETGLPHLAHALCCLMFLWRYVVDGLDLPDDRWAKKEEPKTTTAVDGTVWYCTYGKPPEEPKYRRGDVVRRHGVLGVADHDYHPAQNLAYELVARRPADAPADYVAAEVVQKLENGRNLPDIVWVDIDDGWADVWGHTHPHAAGSETLERPWDAARFRVIL